jgi:hypothetical protein
MGGPTWRQPKDAAALRNRRTRVDGVKVELGEGPLAAGEPALARAIASSSSARQSSKS